MLQVFETRFTDFTSKFWPAVLLGVELLAELPAALLLAADEAELAIPFTSTSSPTWEDSFEVSPVKL